MYPNSSDYEGTLAMPTLSMLVNTSDRLTVFNTTDLNGLKVQRNVAKVAIETSATLTNSVALVTQADSRLDIDSEVAAESNHRSLMFPQTFLA